MLSSLSEWLDAQLERSADVVAVVDDSGELTYRQLHARANQLARHLRLRGVGPDTLVGVCVERSAEMVIALLGVLKTGGAYVPIDPAYPKDRIDFMLSDSSAPVLVTMRSILERGAVTHASPVCIDADWPAIAQHADGPLTSVATLDHLAYTIYTSGSTGRPKGVMVTHRAVMSFLASMAKAPGISPEDVLAAVTSLSFDIAGLEMFLPLVTGARLVVLSRQDASDGKRLRARLAAAKATLLQATPSTFRLLLDAGWPSDVALRVMCGGEAFPESLADALVRHASSVWNMYGPTETTIWSTIEQVTADSVGAPPIGRAIDNTTLHVLDEQLTAVADETPGELYIGGIGLARGYRGRPDLTAERFIPDSFSRTGGRLYRTGDLVRRRADGRLEYLGRLDHQVKIRGFRIELGEIESVLARHPAIKQAAVVAREDGHGGKRLVAYLIAHDARTVTVAELREHLARMLPDYMIPSSFMWLDAMPLTPNGKLDRAALPAPGVEAPNASTSAATTVERGNNVAPRSSDETTLCTLWTDLLGIERVGVRDNFFELGGHSLLAMQLLAGVREQFCVELTLESLFDEPTVEGLCRQIVRIQEHRAEQISAPVSTPADRTPAALHGSGKAAAPTRIARRSGEGPAPLSFEQQGLWLIEQTLADTDGPRPYNETVRYTFSGPLDVPALGVALRALAERHDSLRIVFVERDGVAAQLVSDVNPFPAPACEDLRELAGEAQRAALDAALLEHGCRPLLGSERPPVLARLFRTADATHVLMVTAHHAITDGWSESVFVRELAELYRDAVGGRPASLPDLPIQYVDFATWQRERLAGPYLKSELGFWIEELRDAPPTIDLLTDRRATSASYAGERIVFTLDQAVVDDIAALAHGERATPFMVLLAAFNALLFRYTGQDDLPVGTVAANREHPDTHGLIGLFANVFVVRTKLDGRPTFRALLGRVRERMLAVLAHQHVPFDQVVAALGATRTDGRNPLFQIDFVYEEAAPQTKILPDLDVALEFVNAGTSRLDLTLHALMCDNGLRCTIGYRTDLFDRSTIERMIAHFQHLLTDAIARPDTTIDSLELMTAAQRDQLVSSRNTTERADPSERWIHERFEAQVDRVPTAIAVRENGRGVTYAELDARANQLAHLLIARGAGLNEPIALVLERSVDVVVTLLAILKAGAAYLPIDPNYPAERVRDIVTDAGTRLLVGHSSLAQLWRDCDVQAIVLDDAGALEASPTSRPRTRAGNLAYIIYTSGSTGRPKGVRIPHDRVLRLFTATDAWFHFGSGDVWTFFHSIAFDFSVWEIWGALLYGGSVVVVPYDISRSPTEFYRLLVRERVTILNQTPSAFYQLIAAERELGEPGDHLSLREVIFGGEALDLGSLRPWIAQHPALPRLVNMYGITETTVHVTYRPLTAADIAQARGSLIGRPIPDLQLHVLDARLMPVPIGVPGEIYVGGAGVAEGYVRRPGLTAERFVPDPFSDRPGAVLYRTGDRARYLDEGEVEYLGRIDLQVKIRGFRIELGEIEAVLSEHPAVQNAVVVVREDSPGDKQLVGYWVRRGDSSSDTLRDLLRSRLPAYMIPAALIELPALPLTSNGKLDKKALPAPSADAFAHADYAAPTTSTEAALLRLWSELLRVERIGIRDNFFAVGGHSLLATRLVARVQRELGRELPLRAVFENPTIAQQAGYLATSRRDADESWVSRELAAHLEGMPDAEVLAELDVWTQVELGNVATAPSSDPAAARRALLDRWLAQHRIDASPSAALPRYRGAAVAPTFAEQLHWDFAARGNFPSLSVHATAYSVVGPLDLDALARAVDALVARHESLRATFSIERGELMRSVHARGPVLQIVDLSNDPPEVRDARARELFARHSEPHDLSRETFRACVVRLDEHHHVLILVPHHIVIDGFSWDVLEHDLMSLYRTITAGEPSGLAPLVFSSTDFAFWQTTLERRPVGHQELEFWHRRIAGYEGVELPGDRASRPRSAVGLALDTYASAALPIALDGETWRAIERACAQLSCPPFTVLVTAFLLTIARRGGRRDVCINSSSFHRSRAGSELVLGNLVTPYPLRVALSASATLEDVLRQTQQAILEQREHAQVALTSAKSSWLEWSRYNFNYQLATVGRDLALGEARCERLHWTLQEQRTPHDLGLFVRQSERGIHGELVYNADKFSSERAASFADTLRSIIDGLESAEGRLAGAFE